MLPGMRISRSYLLPLLRHLEVDFTSVALSTSRSANTTLETLVARALRRARVPSVKARPHRHPDRPGRHAVSPVLEHHVVEGAVAHVAVVRIHVVGDARGEPGERVPVLVGVP